MSDWYEDCNYIYNVTVENIRVKWTRTGGCMYVSPMGKSISIDVGTYIGISSKIGSGVRLGHDAIIQHDVVINSGVNIGNYARIYPYQKVLQNPYYVVGTRFPVSECASGILKIGCEIYKIDIWLQFGESIGEMHYFTKAENEEYMSYVKHYSELLKIREDNGIVVFEDNVDGTD